MKYHSVYLSVFLISVISLCGQSIGFWVDNDSLLSPEGEVLNLSNATQGGLNVSIYGATVASLSEVTTSLSAFEAATTPGSALFELQSTLNSSTFSTWQIIKPSPKTGPFVDLDWVDTVSGLTAGRLPVLLVVSQPINEIAISSFVGLVISETFVPPSGTVNIGFVSGTGDARWDSALIGTLDSQVLSLAAIPEPSHFAALFGLLALGIVVWRRRQQ